MKNTKLVQHMASTLGREKSPETGEIIKGSIVPVRDLVQVSREMLDFGDLEGSGQAGRVS